MFNNNNNNKKITFIVYDSILNSVFKSQVLHPILKKIEKNKNLEVNLITFEKRKISSKKIAKIVPAHERLHLIIARSLPFFGKLSMSFASYQLKKVFEAIQSDKIITRGPLAGWITIKSLEKIFKNRISKIGFLLPEKLKVTIQARGLCAEEYKFSKICFNKQKFKKIFRKILYKSLKKIEKETFQFNRKEKFDKRIEAVSPALKEYLITNFNSSKSKIEVACEDFPETVNRRDREKFRKNIRKKLSIPEKSIVYCYSGSYKPWQCIPKAVDFFSEQYKKNTQSFFLILSPDKEKLIPIMKKTKIDKKDFAIVNIAPEDVHKYIAASDVGILFRTKDIINWVSRPTKMLEYQAAGLKIVHNNTIAWLEN